MARHPQPEALADLKGAKRKHPERYRKETPESKQQALGNAPDHLSDDAKAAWFELETYALQGVLSGADRMIMETTAVLVAEFRSNPKDFPAARLGHMIGCLARLGLSPADRQKLGTEKAPQGNEFDDF